MRTLAPALVGQANFGRLEYLWFAKRRSSWGGAFNGQAGRQAIFAAIVEAVAPSMILETGTFRGTTTAFMAETGVPLVTVEGNPRYYGFARMQLRRLRNVDLRLGDSRTEARRALADYAAHRSRGPLLAYLDAHWEADLPLADELDIIFSACPEAVVMIDDFQVPDDPGYGFDNYGPGRALTHEYIGSIVQQFGLATLYPVMRSTEETGSKRGCVVLVADRRWRSAFQAVSQLRFG